MKWNRAVQHLDNLAEACAETTGKPIFLPVTGLWAFGEILGEPRDLETIEVALTVDLPEVHWLGEPSGAQHWANATRLSRNPFTAFWRSAHAPVWNHRVVGPVQVWDNENGTRQEVLDALADGDVAEFRLPAPTDEDLASRVAAERAECLRALREATATYEERRWAPGKLTPHSDALWRASAGYLDLGV